MFCIMVSFNSGRNSPSLSCFRFSTDKQQLPAEVAKQEPLSKWSRLSHLGVALKMRIMYIRKVGTTNSAIIALLQCRTPLH
jgi:hypothetical protein